MARTRKRPQWSWLQFARRSGQIGYALAVILALYSEDFVTMLVLLGMALLGGAFYCGWLCPLGTAQEWIGYLGRKMLRGKRFRVPVKVERWLILSRYVLLLAGFLAWGGMAVLSFLSQPYQSFLSILTGQTAYITWFALAYLALFLISALLIDRPFCRYFCVQGAKYGALSLARVFSIRRDADTCVHCLRCDEACPTQVNISARGHIRHPQCINCLECISACPVAGTLRYGWAFSRPGNKGDKQ